MRKITSILFFAISTSAFAGAAFDGINAQLGVGFSSLGADFNVIKASDQGIAGNISFGYSHAFNKFNLAGNIFYDFGNQKAGDLNVFGSNRFKTNNIWGISIEPGYYFTDSTLFYTKLGYARADSKLTRVGYGELEFGNSNGFLYGLGAKQLIKNNMYLGLEAYQIDFSRESDTLGLGVTNKPTVTYGGLTLGYEFGNHGEYKTSSSHGPGAGAFDGVNIQLGAGFANLGGQVNALGIDNILRAGQKDALANITAGYSHAFNNQFNIAANIFYVFGSGNAGSYNDLYKAEINNIWGASIEPGYYLTDSTLAYVKLGYARADSKDLSQGVPGYSDIIYKTSNGLLFGLGVKQLISDNFYLGIEAYQVDFSTVNSNPNALFTSGQPSVTYGGLLVGYKF